MINIWKSKVVLLAIGFISSLILLNLMYYRSKNINFNDLALLRVTTVIFEDYNNMKINNINFDINNTVLPTIRDKEQDVIISFGNSQSHSVNSYDETKDHLFSYYLNEFNQDNIVLNLSAPNGSLQEMFVSIVNAYHKLGKKFNTAIVSLVFDDTREDGIRDSMHNMILSNKLKLSKYEIGKTILNDNLKKDDNKTNQELLLKDISENYINNHLSSVFDSYENRGNVRSFFYGELYYFRNWILGIKPTSKRKKIKRVYDKNIQALKDIINFTKKYNIDLVLYIAPIRQDIEIPYLKNQYNLFKVDVKEIHKLYDLDKIVPGKYWGVTNDDWVDFMHFKGEGHKILANELQKILLEEKVVK